MFSETGDLIEQVKKMYGREIIVYKPDAQEVEQMVTQYGENIFYDSVEKRKLCCNIRKVLPLKKALEGKEAWICGLRREQASSRENITQLVLIKITRCGKLFLCRIGVTHKFGII